MIERERERPALRLEAERLSALTLFNFYKSHFDRIANQAGHVTNIEPLHQLRAVRFDSLPADVQAVTDIFGAEAFGDEGQNLSLPGSENGNRRSLFGRSFAVFQQGLP